MMVSVEELYEYFLANPSICTDTRKLKKGDLFFALKGENFDGNVYAIKALEKGASLAIVDDSTLPKIEGLVLVANVLESLQQLASYHRAQKNIPILAISGSNGKTTTKELIAGILASQYKTHYTKGNLNNHIGVPLTLLSIPEDTRIAVIEMGANHKGEIKALCEIAQPTHGLLTNVGQAHLEGFGGFEGVKQGKSELYRHLAKHDMLAFINLDEPFLFDLANGVGKKITYSFSEDIPNDQELRLKCLSVDPVISLMIVDDDKKWAVTTHLFGKHNLQNINTAITVANYFKVPTEKIVQFLEDYQPQNNRSQWLERQGVYFLLDAYNANPSSMRASLYSFDQQKGEKKLAILGDMFEVGKSSAEHHLAIAQYAQSLDISHIYLVGQHFKEAAEQLNFSHFDDVDVLKETFDIKEWEGNKVLIKGSRGMALERLLEEPTST